VSRAVFIYACEPYKHWVCAVAQDIFNPLLYRLSYQAKT
jgi:hypothetical protein